MANFRVHARVLDLLGEEQIADLPTAISELFKNAYDAYARQASLDIYADSDYAILWDDGFGMTEEDLETRWLIVGTPSKRLAERRPKPPKGRLPRPVMGEKGIGRLAISRLGDCLLLVSRRPVDGESTKGEFTALFLNWNIAKNPHLLLQDIYVPVVNFESLDELDGGVVEAMVEDFRRSIAEPPPETENKWNAPGQETLRQRIVEQCDRFAPDMLHLQRSALAKKPAGTAFVIGQVHPDLHLYAKPSRTDGTEESDYLIRLLGNYSDRFSEQSPDEVDPFKVDIRIWRDAEVLPRSLINEAEIFSPEDLKHYDHFISVDFDDFGRYSGLLERFDERIALLPEASETGRRLKCGPFSLRLWYWQDQAKTRVPKEIHDQHVDRLDRFGGLMMYRSGLRVLPYGDLSYDWLSLEERRTKWMGRYFFSYRRMFGYVSISNDGNPELRDKAGREGLINNAAYRDLRGTLIRFFKEIAAQYFFRNEQFDKQVEANAQARSVADRARKRASSRRAALKSQATGAISAAKDALIAVPAALTLAREELSTGPTGEELDRVLSRFDTKVRKLQNAVALSGDTRAALSGRHHDLIELLSQRETLAKELDVQIAEARKLLFQGVTDSWPAAEARWRQRQFVEGRINQAKMGIGRAYGHLESEVTAAIHELRAWIAERRESDLGELGGLSADFIKLYTELPDRPVPSAELSDLIERLETVSRRRDTDTRELAERLTSYILAFFQQEAELQADQVAAYSDQEIDRLSQEIRDSLQLAQAGLAAEIADHDLAQAYHGIKGALGALGSMLRRSAKATEQLKLLRSYFSHLELQYRQLQPLYRARRQRRQWITGADVVMFVRGLMAHTLDSNGVRLQPTDKFLAFRVFESTSLVMPVFINLVDNAVYWLRKCNARILQLDVVDRVVTVCDSGPGIPESMKQVVFERFVSTKPRGRGLGLYLVGELLKASGHEIWVTRAREYQALTGACFCIRFSDLALEGDSE